MPTMLMRGLLRARCDVVFGMQIHKRRVPPPTTKEHRIKAMLPRMKGAYNSHCGGDDEAEDNEACWRLVRPRLEVLRRIFSNSSRGVSWWEHAMTR